MGKLFPLWYLSLVEICDYWSVESTIPQKKIIDPNLREQQNLCVALAGFYSSPHSRKCGLEAGTTFPLEWKLVCDIAKPYSEHRRLSSSLQPQALSEKKVVKIVKCQKYYTLLWPPLLIIILDSTFDKDMLFAN